MKVRLSPRFMRRVGEPAFGVLARSWRTEVRHKEHWSGLVAAQAPFVFLLWHEALLPLLWVHRRQGVAIVVSEGLEGRYLSEFAGRIGYRMLPGSSTRGGTRALLGAIHALEAGTTVAFTPDGPTGPRHEVKPGVVAAAQRARVPILPVHAATHSAWRLRSWDRMIVPKPFARVEIAYGAPFTIAPGQDGMAAGLLRSAEALAELERELAP